MEQKCYVFNETNKVNCACGEVHEHTSTRTLFLNDDELMQYLRTYPVRLKERSIMNSRVVLGCGACAACMFNMGCPVKKNSRRVWKKVIIINTESYANAEDCNCKGVI